MVPRFPLAPPALRTNVWWWLLRFIATDHNVHTYVHTTDGVNLWCEYTHNQQSRPTTHIPHAPSITPYALNLRQRLSPSWVFTHPFTPMAGPGAGLHLWRTFTAVTLHSVRVRRCRFVRLHARSQPDTIQASPRCTEVGNASNRVRPNSTSRRVVQLESKTNFQAPLGYVML